MKVAISLDKKVVKELRKIARDRRTTLGGLARKHLQKAAEENATAGQKRHELEALERTFHEIHIKMGQKTWTRADLRERR